VLLRNLIQAASGVGGGESFYDYEIENSVRFDGSSYLSKTFTTPTDSKKYTFSVWLKLTDLDKTLPVIFSAVGSAGSWEEYISTYINVFRLYNGSGSTYLVDTAQRRDPSSWYHLHIKVDTTQATASNRMIMTVNGTPITVASSLYLSQNASTTMNSAVAHGIGYFSSIAGDYYFEGYMADFVFVDGTAYSATDFGEEKNGIWVPKDPRDLPLATNGFYLDFADSSAFGNDVSGNNNDFTVSGLTSSDQMIDTPTNNFPTWSPLLKGISQTGVSTSDANMVASHTGGAGTGYWPSFSTMTLPKNGKVYFEICLESVYNGALIMGIMSKEDAEKYAAGTQSPTLGNLGYWDIHDGSAYAWGGDGQPDYATLGLVPHAGVAGGVVGFAIDLDAGKGWIRVNGTWILSGDPANGTNPIGSDIHTGNGASASGEYVIFSSGYISLNAYTRSVLNCGQDSTFSGRKTAGNYADGNGIGDFLYSVPSGFLALCTANLPEPTIGPNIDDTAVAGLPEEQFNILLYEGNSTNNRDITGVGFDPDFGIFKNRDEGYGWIVVDRNRGDGWSLGIDTGAQESGTGKFDSFITDGYRIDNHPGLNRSSIVNYSWKAGGTASSNTDGDITSNVSANTDAGISIVTYTGNGSSNQTVGHGLGADAAMVIIKRYQSGYTWRVWHSGLSGDTYYLGLNQTSAESSSSTVFNGHSSTTFTVGNDSSVNGSSGTMVAYCFAEVEGFSSFGSYTGNGSADGPFIYTGFRPAWLYSKETDVANSWWYIF
jgi:hypothetical protein